MSSKPGAIHIACDLNPQGTEPITITLRPKSELPY